METTKLQQLEYTSEDRSESKPLGVTMGVAPTTSNRGNRIFVTNRGGGIAHSSRLKYVDQDEDDAFSEYPEMSSSDMLHMFRDYMDSYDQLRLIRMTMRTKSMTMVRMVMVMIMMIMGYRVSADAAQLLATKFSSSTCGSGFTYTAGPLFSLIIKMLVLDQYEM